MSAVLAPILWGWGSMRRSDPSHVTTHYVCHPDRVSCVVCVDAGGCILGFQSLKVARTDNAYALPEGWGIIGTYVAAQSEGRGLGRELFNATLSHAKAYGLREIDATIGADHSTGQAYYSAMGFVPYRTLPGAVGARYIV